MDEIERHSQGKHTALHIAAEGNEKEIVEYLIMKGADTELRNDVSAEPVHGLTQ